jgi:hypothetical protein
MYLDGVSYFSVLRFLCPLSVAIEKLCRISPLTRKISSPAVP